MAKTKRLSNMGRGTAHLYCKPTKEVIQEIRTKYLLGIKPVTLKVPTYYNLNKKKVRSIGIDSSSYISGDCTVTHLECKQGTELEWKFYLHGFKR